MLEIRAEGRSEMVLQGHQESQRTGGDAVGLLFSVKDPGEMKTSGVGERICVSADRGEDHT